ncbi:DUF5683 domain-containing protein [Zunongwangia sp.]|uniref:DUF5683 domain-containing protein n=1 Tax=Zunongwangia sp. TaxID=1965325 RepID=UPI003AA93AC3
MTINQLLASICFLIITTVCHAQKDTISNNLAMVNDSKVEVKKDYKPYNALAPAKAAFYSAILPGLGQIYNGSIWKVPFVYAGIGIPLYIYLDNDKKYDRYRTAYKQRLAGKEDEFAGKFSTESLRRAQKVYQDNKEMSLLFLIGFYALNIVDANVDAHLQQFNVSKDLSLRPKYKMDNFTGKSNFGLSLNFKF